MFNIKKMKLKILGIVQDSTNNFIFATIDFPLQPFIKRKIIIGIVFIEARFNYFYCQIHFSFKLFHHTYHLLLIKSNHLSNYHKFDNPPTNIKNAYPSDNLSTNIQFYQSIKKIQSSLDSTHLNCNLDYFY